jgi:hypothetical protein
MSAIRFRFLFFLVILFLCMVAGTVGFMVTEGLSLGDAFYFSIITIATVGYGDISPASAAGRALAIVLIIMGVGAFMGVFANATEMMLNRREQRERLEKVNMVIGVFFSEIGTDLLALFSDADPNLGTFRDTFLIDGKWDEGDFQRVRSGLKQHKHEVDLAQIDLDALSARLVEERDFLVRLLENPVLLEHESFTSLLWAVFHLAEELAHREDKSALPDSDRLHLAGDAKRAYGLLVAEWLDYMEHLKGKYPYLFSLALRTNPFDRTASPIVR